MSENEHGWKNWGDHPVVVIISLMGVIITIFVFITGKQNLSELLNINKEDKEIPTKKLENKSTEVSSPFKPVSSLVSNPNSSKNTRSEVPNKFSSKSNSIEEEMATIILRVTDENEDLIAGAYVTLNIAGDTIIKTTGEYGIAKFNGIKCGSVGVLYVKAESFQILERNVYIDCNSKSNGRVNLGSFALKVGF